MTPLEVEPLADGVPIDPIHALLRRLTIINASDHTCRAPDDVKDFCATGDAALFGSLLLTGQARRKFAILASGWGGFSALSMIWAGW